MKTEFTKGEWKFTTLDEYWTYIHVGDSPGDIRNLIATMDKQDTTEKEIANATIICKSVNAYPKLIQTMKDLQEVLREKGLNIHADGIDVQLKELGEK